MKKAAIVAVVSAWIMFLSSSVSAQQEPAQTQPKIRFVYNLVSQLSKTCASPESTSQNNCNGYVYGVIDALDAGGLSCPGHPDPTYFGRRVKEDIAAFGRNNSNAFSQPAGSVIASLLKSYGCNYGSSPAETPPACKYAEAYKDKAPVENYRDPNPWFQIWQCEFWANENGNQKLTHDSFIALNNLYHQESSALEEGLGPDAPAVCKVFQDYQRASDDAMRAGIKDKLPETEAVERATRAEEDFLAPLKWSEDEKTLHDLLDCAKWARDSNQTVIGLEVRQLISELYEKDAGALPADIVKLAPACKNASSEADAIMGFASQHVDDTRIMPSDVEPFSERATPLAKCVAQLSKTAYRNAATQLLEALVEINDLMVIAFSNSEAKLVHALPPPQPGSPIVIKVQNSYQQNSNHCTGTVLNLGSISSVDWNCNP